MRKIFLILVLLFLVSGCSSDFKQGIITEKNAPESASFYDDGDVKQRINDLKQGAKPNVKPSKKSQQANQNQAQEQSQVQLENLASEYNQAIIKTNFGNIKVAFYSNDSPITVNNFLNLAKKGFYNGTKFHRIIPDFMIQGGDPNSKDDNWADDGTGGPEYRFQDEFNNHKLVKGSLAMANSGPNTNGSQFFIVTKKATPWLDGKHTNFGYIVEGINVVEKIEAVEVNEKDHPIKDIVVEGIELVE